MVAKTESGGSGGSSPGKISNLRWLNPLKFNSHSLSYSTQNCRRLFPVWMIFASLMTLNVKNKTWISNFQVSMQAETDLPFKCMFKISSSASTEKSRKLFFVHATYRIYALRFIAERSRELRGRPPDRPCKHQRMYAYAVAPSHARGQVGASRSVSRKRSKPKRMEPHAVDPPAFFCERIVPFLCLLVLSTTCGKRSG